MLRIAHILSFLLLSAATFAQRMPVSVTTILTPPYSSSLSAMSESGSTRLMVNLLVNDVTVSELPVKLHIKMESAGITIESLPTQAVAPMLLGGGEARVLTGDDFVQYLRIDNLNFKGFSKSSYQKTGRLPSGLWRISVSVRHFHTDKTISNVGTATAWITTYKPPVLTAPKEGETAPSNAALPLTFSWQPSKLTGGAATVMYRFEMWERRVDGVPAQSVVALVPPIYTTETAGLTATVLPASLALEPGMKYCWRVTAFDPAGRATFEDGGRSEVRTFQYLEKCPEVSGLTIDLKDVTGYARWDADMRHSGGYNVEVYDDEDTYHETRWGYDNKTCGIGGDHGKTWHVRVQGICNSHVVSGWSGWADFTTPDRFKPQTDADGRAYECGELPPPREIANRALAESLQKGDTVEDERGTTKFIIHSATRNDDGSFRGLSYMRLSIWGVKVLGEYDKMMVNTDGVSIGGYAWRSVKSDVLLANPEAIEQWADETALNIAGATYNNTIKDTIRLGGVRFETISREGGRYFALTSDGTKEEITSAISGKSRALVQDSEGHELVIDKDGEPMGVAEYRACGGSKILMRENIREKDSLVVKSGNVKFFGTGGYLFDTYDNYMNAAKGYAERFPAIGEGDYRPAYACAESGIEVQIKAEPYKNITFKTERGVPVICKDGMLSVTARGDRDTTSVYAYDRDNNILGKVNVLSYDKEIRKVCLVPVHNVNVPNAAEIKAGLDKIFAGLMVDFEVTTVDRIEIDYKDKSRGFVHGGSGIVGVYNTDQKSAIDKLKASQPIDNETCYLFLVECGTSNQLDSNDNKQAVGGYMPQGYQFGFIYNEYDNIRTIAHELCHGAFHLRHTFDELDFVAPEGQTDNLMDYAISQPTHLNHWQWKDIHQPKSVRFKWLQDEEGAEAWNKGTVYKCISTEIAKKIKTHYRYFYYPDGAIVDMNDYLPSGFYTSKDADAATTFGSVAAIRKEDKDLYYIFDRNSHSNIGFGYSLGEKAVTLYKISQLNSPNLEKLNPVRVRIEGENVRTVDYHGKETMYSNAVCVCNMTKYRELTQEMLISEVDDPLSDAPRLFYAPKTNEVVVVTEVHDLKWVRLVKDGTSIDLDSLVAQGATYHYYTEAELANTQYNKLRNDVQQAMKEGGKVVMIGLTATMAAPYLIEYAVVYGSGAITKLVEKVGEEVLKRKIEKAFRDFALGCLEEFVVQTMFWMIENPNDWNTLYERFWKSKFNDASDETIEFWEAVVKGGLKRYVSGAKYENISTWLTCLSEFEISRYINLHSKDVSVTDLGEKLLVDLLECNGSLLIKKVTDSIDKGLKEKVENVAIEIGIDNFNQWWTDCVSKTMDEYENKYVKTL